MIIGSRIHLLLCEALCRFECFAVRRDQRKWTIEDLTKAWTGLGSRSKYKPAVDKGFMESTHGRNDRYDCWWNLTKAGAEIVLAWHTAGYDCGDGYELKKTPPIKFPFPAAV